MATSRGADVSAIQATSAWTSDGLAFLIAKASEGQTTRDAKFATHIAAANANRIVTGGYHFGWPIQAVAKEAANYVAAAKAAPPDTHWLDLEAYSDRRNVGSMTAAQIKSWATAWVAAVKKAFPGQKVGVYASLATFQAGWVPTTADAYWVAQYPVAGLTWAQAATRARPKLPAGYPTPLIWQFASTSPALDRDLAYLSSTDLAAWAAEEDDVALTAAQANQLAQVASDTAAMRENLLHIGSLDEKDAKGNPVEHAAGYYLAHGQHDALAAFNAAVKAQTPATTLTDAQLDQLAAKVAPVVAAQLAELLAARLQS